MRATVSLLIGSASLSQRLTELQKPAIPVNPGHLFDCARLSVVKQSFLQPSPSPAASLSRSGFISFRGIEDPDHLIRSP